jgi:futalosine hydrolase
MVPNGLSVDAAEGFAIPISPKDGPAAPFVTGRVLLAAAAPKEAAAALRGLGGIQTGGGPEGDGARDLWSWRLTPVSERFDLVLTGVGKVNAAAGVLAVLDPRRHGAVVSVGIAGSLPGSGLEVGQVVAATRSVYADEGLETDSGFRSLEEMGFLLGPFSGGAVPGDAALLGWLAGVADATGPIATVSTCSGTDGLAARVRERTGALAEAMEGAAIGHAVARRHPAVAFGELRAISNRTGRREGQGWNLDLALGRLSEAIAALGATLR